MDEYDENKLYEVMIHFMNFMNMKNFMNLMNFISILINEYETMERKFLTFKTRYISDKISITYS